MTTVGCLTLKNYIQECLLTLLTFVTRRKSNTYVRNSTCGTMLERGRAKKDRCGMKICPRGNQSG